ncbi:hypothetical protein HYX16_05340 [Candidatus Woesearchaeota archaeon]|nr:hypothetical protein [Candidatus Woesearchaeota archaeon]
MLNKRGIIYESDTAHIAGLIILIAILIILYMLFIPEEAQRDILGGNGIDDSGTSRTNSSKTLLLESPGLVFPESKGKEEISLPSVNLFTKTSQKVTDLAKTVTVTRRLLQDNFINLNFKLEDPNKLKKMSLFFNPVVAEGSLIIELNSNVVFKGKITNEDIPLELPVADLSEENKLKLSVSSPGWRFLSTNEYKLKDLKLIQEISSENKKETRLFSLDKPNVKKAKLSYFLNCVRLKEVGILKIFINDFDIHVGSVVCDASMQTIEIPENNLLNSNVLSFEIDKGDYIIEDLKLKTDTERKSPTFFFDVNKDDLDEKFILKMDLVPNKDDERSSATLLINDERVTLDTERNTFSKDISSLMKEDENFIKILPKNEFEIISMEVFIK